MSLLVCAYCVSILYMHGNTCMFPCEMREITSDHLKVKPIGNAPFPVNQSGIPLPAKSVELNPVGDEKQLSEDGLGYLQWANLLSSKEKLACSLHPLRFEWSWIWQRQI